MKCDICGDKVDFTFLDKIIGTYVYKKGKRYVICSKCQKNLSIEEIRKRL